MKRLISLTMASLMVGSLLPMSAFASVADGWHYEGTAGIINKTERQQANGDNKIGVNLNTKLYTGDLYDKLAAISSDSPSDPLGLEPWEVATQNAPEVQIKFASITNYASGSFDTAKDTGKPYMISEFDIDIEDAVLVKVTDYKGVNSDGTYKVYDDNGDVLYSYELEALDAYDILHLISYTRTDNNITVNRTMADILDAAQEGSNDFTVVAETEGYDQFPDIYVTSIAKSTVGGVNGVSSFKVELRSHATKTDGFVSTPYNADGEDDYGRDSANYTNTTTPIEVAQYTASSLYDDATGKSNSNEFVSGAILKNDILSIKLPTYMKSATRSTANISVVSDEFKLNDNYNYATLVDIGMALSYTRGLDQVAPEERINLSGDIVIKETIAGAFDAVNMKDSKVTFKLNKGFEFYFPGSSSYKNIDSELLTNLGSSIYWEDEYDEFSLAIDRSEFTESSSILETLRIDATTYLPTENGIAKVDDGGIGIEATTAGVGDIATITVVIDGVGYGTIEVAEVIDYLVVLEVDSSADVPVMFSGVNRDNDGLTTDYKNNYTLEVTIRETFPGAWDMTDGFAITLPEEVYVVNDEDYTGIGVEGYDRDNGGVIIIDVNNLTQDGNIVERAELYEKMEKAYVNGDYKGFEFGRRPFDSTNVTLGDESASMTFQLVLTGSYGFEGPVELGLEIYGCDVNPDPVVIAEFVKPFEVGATGNDVIIDYRDTLLATNLTFTEYEAGLLTKLGEYPNSKKINNNISIVDEIVTYKDSTTTTEGTVTGGWGPDYDDNGKQRGADKFAENGTPTVWPSNYSNHEFISAPVYNTHSGSWCIIEADFLNLYEDKIALDGNFTDNWSKTDAHVWVVVDNTTTVVIEDGQVSSRYPNPTTINPKTENYIEFKVDRGDYIQFEGAKIGRAHV